jgi:hypothetical protein
MQSNFFFSNWNYKLEPQFLKNLETILIAPNMPSLGALSLSEYCDGILTFEAAENGLYVFYFPDNTYYVGIAGSCTLLERLAKHLDGRKVGSFNSLLKSLDKDAKDATHFTENQQYFLNAKLLFIPIKSSKLLEVNPSATDIKPLDALEKDLIRLMLDNGFILKNKKIPKAYSGCFYGEQMIV